MTILFNKEKKYLPMFQRVSDSTGVPVSLLLAHARQESAFDPNAYRAEPAINDASYGLVQVLLKTAQGIDKTATVQKLYDPEYNLLIGAKYIAQNMARYPGDIKSAIASYNAGVARKNEQGQFVNSRGVPNVQKYVDKVYGYYVDYTKWLGHGASLVDVSINPWLIAGFSFVLVLTIIGGGVYVSKRKSNRA